MGISYKIKVIIIFLFIIPFSVVNGQYKEYQGFVIKNGGDTIRGTIWYWNEFFAGKTVTLVDSEGKSKAYKPADTKEYQFGTSRYESGYLNDKPKYLKVIKRGKVSLYEYVDKVTIPVPTVGGATVISAATSNYEKICAKVFKDCKPLLRDINAGVYTFENMAQIVANYNQWYLTQSKKSDVKSQTE